MSRIFRDHNAFQADVSAKSVPINLFQNDPSQIIAVGVFAVEQTRVGGLPV
jgi:hypothetical protein